MKTRSKTGLLFGIIALIAIFPLVIGEMIWNYLNE